MLNNYFKIAFRNFKKNRFYSFINIAGLAVGISCFIIILLWIQDELSFDRFHGNAEYLYREVNHEEYSNGESIDFTQSPYALAPILKDEFPEITDVARVRTVKEVIITHNENKFYEKGFLFVEPNFLQLFTFSLINGDKNNVLSKPNSMVITDEMATKYFGKKNPIGETMLVDNKFHYYVTGVIKKPPTNSHLNFNFLVPIENAKEYFTPFDEWNAWAFTNYILLDKNANIDLLNKKISDVLINHQEGAIATVGLQPITKINLYSEKIWGLGGDGNIVYVRIFAIIALFILLTACINFMNLSTARSGLRAKEVGLRKAIGAKRKELILQFFGETFFIALISMSISVLIVFLVLPYFNEISGKQIHFSIFRNVGILAILLVTTLFTGITAGIYPALFLSSFQTTKVLKGTFISGSGGAKFRRILVIGQFTLTIVLIAASLTVKKQLHFIRTRNLGLKTELIASIKLKGELTNKSEFLKSELLNNSGISSIGAATNLPVDVLASFIVNEWDGRTGETQFLSHKISVDYNFPELFGLQILEGRFFSPDYSSDTSSTIINESAFHILGWNSLDGKKCMGKKVIGVVRDFNFASLHNKIGPLIISLVPNGFNYLFVKFNSNDFSSSLKRLENDWNKMASTYPLELQFIDDNIDKLYRSDIQVEKIINAFTILLLFIAGLGLVGLSNSTAEQRTKENGIRKILGDNSFGILYRFSSDFLRWIVISFVIATPIAYYFMNKWLENFAYKTTLSWWIFALSGIIALGIALLTVSWQSWKAATRNPVEALRYE